jgi:hypothetical protein
VSNAGEYADAELVIHHYLAAEFPNARVTTDLPADLADVVPLIQPIRIGGGDLALSLDSASIDVDCFAATRLAVNRFASDVRAALVRAPGYFDEALHVSVKSVRVRNFGWRPYVNGNVRSAGMTADVVLHNHL